MKNPNVIKGIIETYDKNGYVSTSKKIEVRLCHREIPPCFEIIVHKDKNEVSTAVYIEVEKLRKLITR